MIKLRLHIKEGQPVEFPISNDELLSSAIDRALENVPLNDMKKEDVFQALVNGHRIEPDMWGLVKLKKDHNVLVAPIIKGDDGGSIFKQIVIIAATVAATYFFGAAGYTGVQLALATSAVTIGTGLLLNALIPPPVPESGALSLGGADIGSSQMYSISGQSNTTRKFNTVPKVYGQHKMFPIVAANPYTELEVDPDTGQLVQYFYAIYDFGFGPVRVENIQIGDTPISDFADVDYNLYDSKKPVASEGPWDDVTTDSLKYYKGDVENNSVAVALAGNRDSGGPQDTWEAIRNSALNTDGSAQTITLTLVNPTGLYAYSANGTQGPRSIQLEIYFALVGTNDWFAFNDLTYVNDFLGVGGDQDYQDYALEAIVPVFGTPTPYTLLTEGLPRNTDLFNWNNVSSPFRPNTVKTYDYGYPIGTTQFIVKDNANLIVGADFRFNKRNLGKITSITEYIPNTQYCTVTIDTPLTTALTVFVFEAGLDTQSPTPQTQSLLITDNKASFTALTRLIGKARITRQDTAPVYSSFRFTPKNPGQYKVRITRINTTSDFSSQIADTLTWAQISTRFDRNPIQTDKRHLFLELKIRATNQLNGAISNLSAIVSSALEVYDDNTQTWSRQITNNPAWVFVDLLISEVNKRSISKSRLDLPSIVEWAEFCADVPPPPSGYTFTYPRFEANFILDYQTSLQGVLNQVGSAAQASLNIVDGKYGVLIDKLKTVPVQIFTPRNSVGFQSNRVYTKKPDAVSVKYIDPSVGWQVAETTVYDNGFDQTTALEIDELTSFACTNQEQAWRFGRYMMAQNRLRQETISITVDFEHLVCSRGDYVQITQDVMKVGGFPARVKSVSGNQVTVDDAFEFEIGPSYGFVYRSPVDGIVTNTLTVISADTFDLDGPDIPAVGDLIIIGVVGQVVYDCIVKSISPNDDLTANVTLVEKADAIYDAESTDVFPVYDPKISQTSNQDIAPPGEVEELEITANTWECDGAGYRYYIDLDWDVPISGAAFEYFQVFVDYGRGYTDAGTTRDSIFSYTVDETRLGAEHKFKVIAVSATGKKLDLGAVDFVAATPMVKTDRPSDVTTLAIDITDQVLQLSWQRVSDCDVAEYLIRYTPVTSSATWEGSIPLARVNRDTSTTAVQARTGSYLIKAVDFAGNESNIAAVALTTIPNLFNLNIIEETSDFPGLNGSFDRTEKVSGALLLREAISGLPQDIEYYSDGYYYYESLLDLGEIFTVRLQSLIQAEGFTNDDLMSNWITLDSVLALANSGAPDWDVETEYRATNELNVIADWLALSDIDPIGAGDPDNFTPWRKFTIGDATGRIFQFRLKLISNLPSVTPRVFDGKIRADMPDRREEYANLTSTGGSYTLTYATPFKGPGTTPVVTVSVDDLDGARVIITSKTLAGCVISFVDVNDDPVDRTFDVAVSGYGRQALSVI